MRQQTRPLKDPAKKVESVRQVGRSQLLKIILLKRKVSVQHAGGSLQ